MARGFKTGGKNFKPGQSGNPKGPAKIPDDIRESRKLTQMEFERILNKYLYFDKSEIQMAANDPSTPLIELLVGSVIHKALIEGDEKRLDFLISRLLGKMVQPIAHEASSDESRVIIVLPSNGREIVPV